MSSLNLNNILLEDDEYINNLDKIRKCTDNHILYTDSEELEEWKPHEYRYNGVYYYGTKSDFLKRTSIKKNKKDKEKIMTIWCEDCNTIYHAVCKNGIKQIIDLYNIQIINNIQTNDPEKDYVSNFYNTLKIRCQNFKNDKFKNKE